MGGCQNTPRELGDHPADNLTNLCDNCINNFNSGSLFQLKYMIFNFYSMISTENRIKVEKVSYNFRKRFLGQIRSISFMRIHEGL